MIEAYEEHISCHYEQQDANKGILLLIPTQVIPFDSKKYPSSDFIVLLAASDQSGVHSLGQYIPKKRNLVFKLIDDITKEVILQEFPSKRVTSFVSYTTQAQHFQLYPSVVTSSVLEKQTIPCYQENGYTSNAMEQFFERGAISFTIYEHGHPISTCFSFQNYDNIWEIGGVYTAPSHRKEGLARMVVETALHTLLSQHNIPRYQVSEDNIPSIRLAETLGLTKFIVTEHFFYNTV